MGAGSAVNPACRLRTPAVKSAVVPAVSVILATFSAAIQAAPLTATVEPVSVMQGSYAVVNVAGVDGSGKVEALDRIFPLFRVDGGSVSPGAGGLRALVPVPLATNPGRKWLTVRVNKRTTRLQMVVEKRAGEKTQKLSALTVDDKRAMALKDDKAEMRALLRKTGENAMWSGPLRHPIPGRISAVFGQRRVYGGGATWFHSGVDFAMPKGWPIVAVAPGRVSAAGMMDSYGNTVVLDHGQTVHTVYMHMSKVLVSRGDQVNQGQVIGLVGETGMALGPHLHFSSYMTTVPVDPLEFLSRGLP